MRFHGLDRQNFTFWKKSFTKAIKFYAPESTVFNPYPANVENMVSS